MESGGKVCPGPTPLHPPLQYCLMPLPPPHLDRRIGSAGAIAEGAGEGPELPGGFLSCFLLASQPQELGTSVPTHPTPSSLLTLEGN